MVSFSERQNGIEREWLRLANEPLKLHLGCGDHRIPGYVNCDLHQTSAADVTFDCEMVWPIPANSVSTIYCSHLLEHLTDFRQFFREAHRVLRPDGTIQIRVPFAGHRMAHVDITHVTFWYAESFCFLQPGYSASVHNAQHNDWRHFFSVEDCVSRVTPKLTPFLKYRWLRRRILPLLRYFTDVVEELWVMMIPLKTTQQIEDWKVMHRGNSVANRYSMYRHDLEGRLLGEDESCELVDWRADH